MYIFICNFLESGKDKTLHRLCENANKEPKYYRRLYKNSFGVALIFSFSNKHSMVQKYKLDYKGPLFSGWALRLVKVLIVNKLFSSLQVNEEKRLI